jgi:hypothetical protein
MSTTTSSLRRSYVQWLIESRPPSLVWSRSTPPQPNQPPLDLTDQEANDAEVAASDNRGVRVSGQGGLGRPTTTRTTRCPEMEYHTCFGADSGAAGPASGCSSHSLETCPRDGQSAARAQRYASQLEQLVDEDGVVAAMVDEIEIPTKHGGCKAGEYIPGLATIAAHTPLRQDRGRDARAGGLGSHTVCSRMPGAVSSVSYSNEAVTSIPTATGRSRSATPSLPPADAPRRCTGH